MELAVVVVRVCAVFGLLGSASAFYCPPLKTQVSRSEFNATLVKLSLKFRNSNSVNPVSPLQGVQCYNEFGVEANCTEVQSVGSYGKCKEFYVSPTSDVTSCGPEGWTIPEFSCQIGKFLSLCNYYIHKLSKIYRFLIIILQN